MPSDTSTSAPEVSSPTVDIQSKAPEVRTPANDLSTVSEKSNPFMVRQSKKNKKTWIVSLLLVALALALGLGLGIGLSWGHIKPGPGPGNPPTTSATQSTTNSRRASATPSSKISATPSSTTSATPSTTNSLSTSATASATASATSSAITGLAASFCFPDTNFLSSARFENLSEWTVEANTYHWEQANFTDGTPAGIYLPASDYYNYGIGTPYTSVNRTVILEPNTLYEVRILFSVYTPESPYYSYNPNAFAKLTNFTATINDFTTTLDDGTLDSYDGGVYTTSNMTGHAMSDPHGQLSIFIAAESVKSDIVVHYVSIYNHSDNSCPDSAAATVGNIPWNNIESAYINYYYRNTTWSERLCVFESNILPDPKFEEISTSTNGTSWVRLQGSVEELQSDVFPDNSPAGIIVRWSNSTEPATILQKVEFDALGSTYILAGVLQFSGNNWHQTPNNTVRVFQHRSEYR
ncbi:hypothetical protein V1505DRAFT_43046 [Lipomyces doorenjongii]